MYGGGGGRQDMYMPPPTALPWLTCHADIAKMDRLLCLPPWFDCFMFSTKLIAASLCDRASLRASFFSRSTSASCLASSASRIAKPTSFARNVSSSLRCASSWPACSVRCSTCGKARGNARRLFIYLFVCLFVHCVVIIQWHMLLYYIYIYIYACIDSIWLSIYIVLSAVGTSA